MSKQPCPERETPKEAALRGLIDMLDELRDFDRILFNGDDKEERLFDSYLEAVKKP